MLGMFFLRQCSSYDFCDASLIFVRGIAYWSVFDVTSNNSYKCLNTRCAVFPDFKFCAKYTVVWPTQYSLSNSLTDFLKFYLAESV